MTSLFTDSWNENVIENPSWYIDRLACPQCRQHLRVGDSVQCDSCGFSDTSLFDLRAKGNVPAELTLPRVMQFGPEERLREITIEHPTVTYEGPQTQRDCGALMSLIMEHSPPGADILDLGCGPRDHAVPVQHLGHRYVGVDYCNPAADFLADAHALPFQDDSFDCVLSYAVLEHLHNPFIAIDEVRRVLKPNGIYIGTVSLGEPFHESFFHHTPWGFLSLVDSTTDLRAEQVWSSMDTLRALSRMGRYSRPVRWMLGGLNRFNRLTPFLTPRKMKWSSIEKKCDEVYRTGSLGFLVRKCVS